MENVADLDLESVEAMLKETKKQEKIKNSKKEETEKKHRISRSKSRKKKHRKNRSGSKSRSSSKTERKRKDKHNKDKKKNEKMIDPIKEEEEFQKKQLKALEEHLKEAQKQAEDAKRDDATVLVLQLPLLVSEHDIYKFFSIAKCGPIRDIRIIKDPRTGRSKGIAYVEFYHQESILKAMTMNGQEILGNVVKVHPSQAEKNRAHAAAKQLKVSKVTPVENPAVMGNMRIYVGGLVDQLADIQEQDLRDLFSSFGEIEYVDIHKDQVTGKCKGYAFIQYKNVNDARAAIEQMNGFKINNKPIKVSTVQPNMPASFNEALDLDEESGNLFLHSAQSKAILMQKLTRETLPINPMVNPPPQLISGTNIQGDSIASLGLGLQGLKQTPLVGPVINNESVQISGNPTKSILLTNMFSINDFKNDHSFLADLNEEVEEECSKYGKVEKLIIEPDSEGNIWVKYDKPDNAVKFHQSLNNRYFNGKKIESYFVNEMYFDNRNK